MGPQIRLQKTFHPGGGAENLKADIPERNAGHAAKQAHTRIGDLAALIGRHRSRFAAVPRALSPRRFWQNVIAGPIAEAVLAGRSAEAEARLAAAIGDHAAGRDAGNSNSNSNNNSETVFLVGAGPGDPDLLTLRALHALADADVVFYDELVTAAVLDRARRGAEQVFVGKRCGAPGVGQDEINRRMVAAARTGRRVVRLAFSSAPSFMLIPWRYPDIYV